MFQKKMPSHNSSLLIVLKLMRCFDWSSVPTEYMKTPIPLLVEYLNRFLQRKKLIGSSFERAIDYISSESLSWSSAYFTPHGDAQESVWSINKVFGQTKL